MTAFTCVYFLWLSVACSSLCISRLLILFEQLSCSVQITILIKHQRIQACRTKCGTCGNKGTVERRRVCQSLDGDILKCVCVFGYSPIPMSFQLPPVPGCPQQLQGSRLQQWCPSTTHYLEGFSLSRRYSARNGVKLRCKERLVSIGSFSHPLFMISL